MNNFSKKFEDHKIPEFYDSYFDYGACKKIISAFKKSVPKLDKLVGFYNVDTFSREVKKLEIKDEELKEMAEITKSKGQNLTAQSPEAQLELNGEEHMFEVPETIKRGNSTFIHN